LWSAAHCHPGLPWRPSGPRFRGWGAGGTDVHPPVSRLPCHPRDRPGRRPVVSGSLTSRSSPASVPPPLSWLGRGWDGRPPAGLAVPVSPARPASSPGHPPGWRPVVSGSLTSRSAPASVPPPLSWLGRGWDGRPPAGLAVPVSPARPASFFCRWAGGVGTLAEFRPWPNRRWTRLAVVLLVGLLLVC